MHRQRRFLSLVLVWIFVASGICSEAFAYECDVTPEHTIYPNIPSTYVLGRTAAERLTMAAKYTTIDPMTEYRHGSVIDGLFSERGHTGLYLTDCSCFVNYLLHYVAPSHYKEIYDTYGDRSVYPSVPRAHSYCQFFNALQSNVTQSKRWQAVSKVAELQPGDILGWSLIDPRNQKITLTEQHPEDTGHLMVVATVPQPAEDGAFLVDVYDSSSVPHFGFGAIERKTDRNGVGKGKIKLFVDSRSAPIGYQFCPAPECSRRQSDQIAAGRMASYR